MACCFFDGLGSTGLGLIGGANPHCLSLAADTDGGGRPVGYSLKPPSIVRWRARGFSLVELLVVIAVAALLLGILLPVLGRVRDQGRAAACMSNLRQIGTAWQIYCVDNPTTGLPAYNTDTRLFWFNYLLGGGPSGTQYLDDSDSVPQCPCWERPTQYARGGGYGMTDLVLWPSRKRVRQVPNFYSTMLLKPSDWPVFMDSASGVVYSLDDPVADAGAASTWDARHNGLAHVLMVDLHLETVAYGDKRWHQAELNDRTHCQQ
jgi:prepilin-type N-terminal cleavage/methylation domain-containing protein/prepilin-type processing-associated H-X9-DG protein